MPLLVFNCETNNLRPAFIGLLMAVEKRKRVTVFFSDIVGYNIMMERNEDEALSLLDEARHYQKPVIVKNEGEIIKEMGDGIFAVFNQVDEAVRCAVEIQQQLNRSGKYKLRIGIHTGEVIFKGIDMYGDGVNLTAGLAKFTSSGSIILSGSAFKNLGQINEVKPVFWGEKKISPFRKLQRIYVIQGEFLEVPEGIELVRETGSAIKLPFELTNFIGRQTEIEMIRNLVRSNRLVTLTGSGGVGKTRLALTVLAELDDHFRDGVRFIEMVGIKHRELAVKAIANALKIHEIQDSELTELIVNKIKDKHMLLVLDHCDTTVEACAEIIDYLFKQTTGLRILATSRISLGLPGELAWRVPSMTYPGENSHEYGLLGNFESVSLFIEKAKRIKPDLKLDAHRAVSIASICRNLAGIPLAIELAAAKLRNLDPNALSQKIKERFRITRENNEKIRDREGIIKESLSWSLEMLEEDARELFFRLSMFPGIFDQDSVRAICSYDPLSPGNIEELLNELDHENLIKKTGSEDNRSRYIMLPVIRVFAKERSGYTHEKNHLTQSYYSYFKRQIINAYNQRFENETYWLNWLEVNLPNINLVYDYQWISREQHLEYAGFLGWFYYSQSHIWEGIKRLESTLADYSKMNPPKARGNQYLGLLYGLRGDFIEASKLLYESVKIWKKLDDKHEYALALMHAGLYTTFFDTKSGLKYLKESEEYSHELEDPVLDLMIRTKIAFAYISDHQPYKAEPIIDENIRKAGELDLPSELLANAHYYADCALLSDKMDQAEKRYLDSLKMALDKEDGVQVTWELQGLIMTLIGKGEYEKAFKLNGALKFRHNELGIKKILIPYWENKLHALFSKAEKELGKNKILEYEDLGEKMNFEKAVNYALTIE